MQAVARAAIGARATATVGGSAVQALATGACGGAAVTASVATVRPAVVVFVSREKKKKNPSSLGYSLDVLACVARRSGDLKVECGR